MECEGIFQMVTDAYENHGYTCGVIVSDDDSTMKSNLKHSYKYKIEAGLMSLNDWPKTRQKLRKDSGRLPIEIPEPRFLADFNHRVKTVGKAVYLLASLPQKESKVTKDIANRMKLYWGSMLKQIRYLHWEKNEEEIKRKVLAPVEHLFNDHQYCDHSWCYVLKAQKENKPYVPDEKKPLFNKQTDEKMYSQLKESVARFQTEQNVIECLHKYDTQSNEGLNMSVSRYVPKFKHYGTSMSLNTRVRCVIGTHNMGYSTYYQTLLTNLGCLEERDGENRHLSSGIARIGKIKSGNKVRKQTLEAKRRRKHGMQARTRQQIYEERVDKAQNMGMYESGIAILGDGTEEHTQQSSKLNKNNNKSNTKICSSCGGTGHKTWRTKTCPNHHEYLKSRGKRGTKRNEKRSHLEAIGNSEDKVSKKNKIDSEDDGGDEEIMGDFCVASFDNEATPMTAVEGLVSSSKNVSKSVYNIFCKENKEKNIEVLQRHEVSKNSTENTKSASTYLNSTQNDSLPPDTMSVQDIMYTISNEVKNIPDPTVVNSQVHKKIDTGVESTKGKKNILFDSIDNFNITVEEHVKILKKKETLESDVESLGDDDSELSFFTADY